MLKSRRKAYHAGPLGQLKPLEDTLLRYVFEQHKQGFVVDTFKIALRASFLSTGFHEKSFTARCSIVR